MWGTWFCIERQKDFRSSPLLSPCTGPGGQFLTSVMPSLGAMRLPASQVPLVQPPGQAGVCSVADSSQTNDSVHQKAFPIPPGCINASATTISKEISFIQIPQSPLVPRAKCAHSSSEEGTGTRSQSCPSLSSPLISPQVIHSLAFYLLDLSFINHKKLAVVHVPESLQFGWELLPCGYVRHRAPCKGKSCATALAHAWQGGTGATR